MIKRKSELHLFFPTPVWTSKIDHYAKVNKKIYDYILKQKKLDPAGIKRSNHKGWHSKDFDLKNNASIFFINSISSSLNEALTDMQWDLKNQTIKITSMWAIINNKEALNERHIHGNNFISAAYYVKAPTNCGDIVFYDPRSAPSFSKPQSIGSNKLNANYQSIAPQEGLLVLFPSYLHHSVEENKSNDERIVISFNINLINS